MSNRTSRATTLGVLTTAAALIAVGAAPAAAGSADGNGRTGYGQPRSYELTVMGTSDLHGNVLNWDYFANAEYTDRPGNDVGLAKIASLVEDVREAKGAENTLLVDNGDLIQGTPLAYYYAKVDPITEGARHPMATAMNALDYDAAVLGNHEFNYGLPLLRAFEDQVDSPLLGANVLDAATGEPAFAPYTITTVRPDDRAKPIKVGFVGVTTPGSAIWDRANVEGLLEFGGVVEQAARWVPEVRQAGADVVVVLAHTGADGGSSYGDALPFPENAAVQMAEQVPGIDAVLTGHAHREIPERVVVNQQTGEEVVLSMPLRWGMRLSVFDIDLSYERGTWAVDSVNAELLNANTVPEHPGIVDLVADQHETVVDYVNSVVGTSLAPMSAATARYEDTAALDFINYVQAAEVKRNLTGTDAELPVLSIAAPFNAQAAIPAGDVSVRDIAGLYIFDNTLLGVRMTGAQIEDYLEFSARYFQQVSSAGPLAPSQVTNAVTPTAGTGTPDYNYDVMAGLDAPLTYRIDLSQPVGSRIVDLAYGGAPIDPAQEFVVAVNNYRQSGGGNFPHVKDAPVVHNAQQEIRQLMIDWVTAQGVIDPAVFSSTNPDWWLTFGDQPLDIVE
ncbi:bifunctional UDP-sugar hydrolase/5'-nucleotidase [Actinotalea sp. Marseille-Q4924]|uniref:bifunctional metallophosphatase/5'-nucleotidase n=1 Tax=Actinotalea sp. Marseille-Q4924 TaxID=2866571 RepID=UPI001CE3D637|nr:5'-nucleotidase C-terminal domain-containing protein [Actinotalea sp. Marseille-Q4924]